jgi:hypothetical protein
LNAVGRHHWPPPEDTIALLRELARLQIARLLNRSGKPTGHGNGWTEQRVRGFRKHHDIAVSRALGIDSIHFSYYFSGYFSLGGRDHCAGGHGQWPQTAFRKWPKITHDFTMRQNFYA